MKSGNNTLIQNYTFLVKISQMPLFEKNIYQDIQRYQAQSYEHYTHFFLHGLKPIDTLKRRYAVCRVAKCPVTKCPVTKIPCEKSPCYDMSCDDAPKQNLLNFSHDWRFLLRHTEIPFIHSRGFSNGQKLMISQSFKNATT